MSPTSLTSVSVRFCRYILLIRVRYNPDTDLLSPSRAVFEDEPPLKTRVVLRVLEVLRLVELERVPVTTATQSPARSNAATSRITSTTNLTILNFLLVHFGPLHERTLCLLLGLVQVSCSVLAFGIRYGLGALVYGGERR